MAGDMEETLTGFVSCLFFVTLCLAIFQVSIYFMQSRYNTHPLPISVCSHEHRLRKPQWQRIFNHIRWVDVYYVIFIVYQLVSALYFILSIFFYNNIDSKITTTIGIIVEVVESLPYPCCFIAMACMYTASYPTNVFAALLSAFILTIVMLIAIVVTVSSSISAASGDNYSNVTLPFSTYSIISSQIEVLLTLIQESELILNLFFVLACIIFLITAWGLTFRSKTPYRKGMLRLFICLLFQCMGTLFRMSGPAIENAVPSFKIKYIHFIGQCVWCICAGQIFIEQKICYAELSNSFSLLKSDGKTQQNVPSISDADKNYAISI